MKCYINKLEITYTRGDKMLPFFTDPYPNELIYSAIARYHFYHGSINFKDTLEELFQSRTIGASLEIGSRFTLLVENIGPNHLVESLMADHSIYPYYAPFLSKVRQKNILTDVKENGGKLHHRIGMTAGSICRKNGIYYCSKCAFEDIERYGEPFIHREHQLQGIDYCANHKCKLRKYASDSSLRSRLEYIRFEEQLLDLTTSEEEDVNEYREIQIRLAEMANQLFQIPLNQYSNEEVKLKYRTLFRKYNLINFSNQVKQEELHKSFIESFPQGFLEKYECTVDYQVRENWLKLLLQNVSTTIHPFRHLLVLYFLGEDIISFMKVDVDNGPFGKGPWPCLNKIASHYRKEVITNISLDRRKGGFVGIFSCSCGFVYSRRGPDINGEDKYTIYHIYRYGEEWLKKLQELNEKGLNLKEIAEVLYVSSGTVKKYLINPSEAKKVNPRISKYRLEMLRFIEKFPHYKRSDIYKELPRIYDYLRFNDKEWFNTNMPPRRNKIQPKHTVNWELRDQEYYEKIRKFQKEFKEPEKPIRFSMKFIGRRLGILGCLENSLIKMPKTNELLTEITESVREFQYRRCKILIDKMLLNNEPVSLWKVREKCNITKKEHFNEIKPRLEEYIKLNQHIEL